MSNSKTTRLIIKENQLFQEVWLEDTNFRELAHGSNGNLTIDVFPGLYVLKSRMGKEVAKTLVEVDGSQEVMNLEAPVGNWTTSMPLNSRKTEFFDKRVNFITDLVRLPAIQKGEGSSVFIFATGKGRTAESLHKVRLETVDGNLLFHFKDLGETQVLTELKKFYAGVTVQLSPGPYRLISDCEGMEAAMMIYLFPRWQTRIFAEDCENGLQLSELSITMDREGAGYDPNRRDLRTTALALESMRNVDSRMPESDQEEVMLMLKFENPMLGLYWLHLAQKMPSLNLSTVEMVLGNMQSLIPFHPDLVAAWLGFRKRFGQDLSPSLSQLYIHQFHSFSTPPMLMSSHRILMEASLENPAWVEADSFLENMIPSVVGTGPWLLWKAGEGQPEERQTEEIVRSGPFEKEKMRSLIKMKLDETHEEVKSPEDDTLKSIPSIQLTDDALKEYFTRTPFPTLQTPAKKTESGTEELVTQLVSLMIPPNVFNGSGKWREQIAPVGRLAMSAISSACLGGLWEGVLEYQKQKFQPATNAAYQLTEIPKSAQFEMVGLAYIGHPEPLIGWLESFGFETDKATSLVQKLKAELQTSISLTGLSKRLKLPPTLVADGMLDAIQEIANAQALGDL